MGVVWYHSLFFIFHTASEEKKEKTHLKQTFPCMQADVGVSSISPLALPHSHSQGGAKAGTRLCLLGLVGRDGGLVLVGSVAAARGVHALDGCVALACLLSLSLRGRGARRTLALLDLRHGGDVVLGVLQSGLEAHQWGSCGEGGNATYIAGVAVDNVALLKGAVLAGSVSLARHVCKVCGWWWGLEGWVKELEVVRSV